jgi:hypothetical protein
VRAGEGGGARGWGKGGRGEGGGVGGGRADPGRLRGDPTARSDKRARTPHRQHTGTLHAPSPFMSATSAKRTFELAMSTNVCTVNVRAAVCLSHDTLSVVVGWVTTMSI